MSEFRQKAIDKLAEEAKNVKFNKYGMAMKSAVRSALEEFCRQDDEFAQAVVQGGSFADCMTAVAKKGQGRQHIRHRGIRRGSGILFPRLEGQIRDAHRALRTRGRAEERPADRSVELSVRWRHELRENKLRAASEA